MACKFGDDLRRFLDLKSCDELVLGLTCLVSVAFASWVCYTYYCSTFNRSKHHVEQSCSNPDCVRCIAKKGLNSTICDRMECVLGSRGSDVESLVSDRLRRSVAHHLMVSKMEEFENDYTIVGASELQCPTIFYLQDLTCSHLLDYHSRNSVFNEAIATMENHYQEVREEFCELWNEFTNGGGQEGWNDNSLPNEEGNWYAFHLINQGKPQSHNLHRCPITSGLLEKLRVQMMTGCIFGFATFSVIMPGTHISQHCGATNIRARCHLGLVIPDGCTMTVNREELQWAEGGCLVFDDSFQHEVHHTGDAGPRGVLMVDLWHPDLTTDERELLEYTFSSDLLLV